MDVWKSQNQFEHERETHEEFHLNNVLIFQILSLTKLTWLFNDNDINRRAQRTEIGKVVQNAHLAVFSLVNPISTDISFSYKSLRQMRFELLGTRRLVLHSE